MAFPVCCQPDLIQFEALPVAKITDYPLEKKDYMPFAQARICYTPSSFVVQLWAFEVTTAPKSQLKALFAFAPHQVLTLSLCRDGENFAGITRGGQSVSFAELGAQPPVVELFEGEDLQGIYWGGTFTLSRDVLESIYGQDALAVGHVIPGNLYKLCDDPAFTHQGSFFAADFVGGKGFGPGSFGEFVIVDY